jgi:hypothetical protein
MLLPVTIRELWSVIVAGRVTFEVDRVARGGAFDGCPE